MSPFGVRKNRGSIQVTELGKSGKGSVKKLRGLRETTYLSNAER